MKEESPKCSSVRNPSIVTGEVDGTEPQASGKGWYLPVTDSGKWMMSHITQKKH